MPSSPKLVVHSERRPASKSKGDYGIQKTGKVTKLLSVTPIPEDQETLQRILRGHRWQVLRASSGAEAMAILTSQRIPIVLCENELRAGSWKDIIAHSGQCRETPIMIVTSRLADDYLWAEVLNLGAYDVLSRPFDEQEVLRVIGGAWLRKSSPIRASAANG